MEELIIKAQKGDVESFTKIVLFIEGDLYKTGEIIGGKILIK